MSGIYWFDGVVGMAISVWICYTGIKIFLESYNVLMDISIDKETQEKILELAKKYESIKQVNEIVSTPVGYRYVVFLNISVDGNLTTFESHNIADKLENDITNIDKVYKTIVHVEPI